MTQIHSYLTFNGNCREAMTFYQQCLGGELVLHSVGESPMAAFLPEHIKQYILHSTLKKGALVLMASDMVDEKGLIHGNSVSLSLQCSSEEELRTYYRNLSAGGEATHPVEHTFWDTLFGDLRDKFGNHWLLSYNQNP